MKIVLAIVDLSALIITVLSIKTAYKEYVKELIFDGETR